MNGKITRGSKTRVTALMALAAALVTAGPVGTFAQTPAPAPAPAVSAPRSFELSLAPDKLIYKKDDAIVFTVVSAQACSLKLTLVDASGDAGILFPNQVESNNALEANKEVQIPAGRVVFKLKEPGTQTVIATCTAADGARGRTQLRVEVD